MQLHTMINVFKIKFSQVDIKLEEEHYKILA